MKAKRQFFNSADVQEHIKTQAHKLTTIRVPACDSIFNIITFLHDSSNC